jgi:hypothetical protein
MDKRKLLMEKIYRLHRQLLDVFHTPASDNLLVAEFCGTFVDLVNAIKPNNSQNRLARLFIPKPDFSKKDQLRAHLISASAYAADLKQRITENPELMIENETVALIFDFAKLLQAIEKSYKIPFGEFAGSRNQNVDAYTSFKVASLMFWSPKMIERSNMLNGFTIFALRQSLELAGKELIGIKHILNSHGEVDFYSSQLPWKFIVEYKNKPYFKLPFDAAEMQVISKWSNNFVHTGKDAMGYVTAEALKVVNKLYIVQKTRSWDGQMDYHYSNEISNIQALKKDFTVFLSTRKNRSPVWAPSAKLAYVTG